MHCSRLSAPSRASSQPGHSHSGSPQPCTPVTPACSAPAPGGDAELTGTRSDVSPQDTFRVEDAIASPAVEPKARGHWLRGGGGEVARSPRHSGETASRPLRPSRVVLGDWLGGCSVPHAPGIRGAPRGALHDFTPKPRVEKAGGDGACPGTWHRCGAPGPALGDLPRGTLHLSGFIHCISQQLAREFSAAQRRARLGPSPPEHSQQRLKQNRRGHGQPSRRPRGRRPEAAEGTRPWTFKSHGSRRSSCYAWKRLHERSTTNRDV